MIQNYKQCICRFRKAIYMISLLSPFIFSTIHSSSSPTLLSLSLSLSLVASFHLLCLVIYGYSFDEVAEERDDHRHQPHLQEALLHR